MSYHMYALGGGDEVGGSSYFLQFDETKIIIDAGARMRGEELLIDYEKLVYDGLIDTADEISAVIITHGHLDHIGSIMNLFKFIPESTPLYMTKATREILRFQITESFKQQEREFDEDLSVDEDLLFSRLYKASLIEEGETIDIDDVECTFFRAGHIIGAVSCYFVAPWLKVFWTADFCNYDQLLVKGCDFSSIKASRPDYIISESTYGQDTYSDESMSKILDRERATLIQTVNDILQKKGRVLIPAFAIGRSQEIIKLLSTAIKKKQLNTSKIYVGGSAWKMTKMLIRDFNAPIDEDLITEFNWRKQEENFSEFSGVIVASSGMMTEGSMSYRISQELILESSSKPAAILFSGYLDAESPGRRLLNLQEKAPIGVRVEQFRLSAHAKVNGILDCLEQIDGKNWVFIHGEGDKILHHAQNRKNINNLNVEKIERLTNNTIYMLK